MNYTKQDREIDMKSGAATLVLRLWENVQDLSNFWQRVLKWNQQYLSEKDLKKATNISTWYKIEKWNSYSSPNYKNNPEKEALIKKHRQDPNYIFKNIVEMFVRKMFKEYFTDNQIEAKVYVTSDSDDALAGIDIIVEIDNKVFGIDVCCTSSEITIEKKTVKNICTPIEYNLYKKTHLFREIPRIVFPVDKNRLSIFLEKCMNEVEINWNLKKGNILKYFQNSSEKYDPTKLLVWDYKDKILRHIDSKKNLQFK